MLVELSEAGIGGVVVGEECHIVAREADGPRGREEPEQSLDSYLNHILLCPTHHRVIDEQPALYSAAALRAMRRNHEEQVRAGLDGRPLPIEMPAADYRGIGFGEPFVAWKLSGSTIVVYSFGSPPVRLASGHLIGSGFQFLEYLASSPPRMLLVCTEGQPDVEFWIKNDAVHVIQQTFDPDSHGFVRLAEHHFDCSGSPVRHSISLLLSPPTGPASDLEALASEFRQLSIRNSGQGEILLYRLRNAGIRDPRRALEILSEMKSKVWYDGATAESGLDVERDLRLVLTFAPVG